jgi:hypothetical protein
MRATIWRSAVALAGTVLVSTAPLAAGAVKAGALDPTPPPPPPGAPVAESGTITAQNAAQHRAAYEWITQFITGPGLATPQFAEDLTLALYTDWNDASANFDFQLTLIQLAIVLPELASTADKQAVKDELASGLVVFYYDANVAAECELRAVFYVELAAALVASDPTLTEIDDIIAEFRKDHPLGLGGAFDDFLANPVDPQNYRQWYKDLAAALHPDVADVLVEVQAASVASPWGYVACVAACTAGCHVMHPRGPARRACIANCFLICLPGFVIPI